MPPSAVVASSSGIEDTIDHTRSWTAPLDVRELFAVPEDLTPEERDALRSLLPSWTYLLDDLSREADARIEDARDDLVARIAIEALVHLRGLDAEALPRELLRLRSLLTAVLDAPRGRLLLGMVFSYLATTAKVDTQTVHAAVRKTLPRRTTKLMLNPLEKYVQDRVDEAAAKAAAKATAKAASTFLRKGKAEGRGLGQLELLRALLQKRFGPLPDLIDGGAVGPPCGALLEKISTQVARTARPRRHVPRRALRLTHRARAGTPRHPCAVSSCR